MNKEVFLPLQKAMKKSSMCTEEFLARRTLSRTRKI